MATRGKKNVNGEGSIRQRKDGRYEGRLFLPQSDGTFRRVTVYGKSWEEAHDKLTELKAGSAKGIPVEATRQTVAEYLAYWLANIARPAVRASTYATYELLIRLYIAPGLGRKKLAKLTAADIRAFLGRVSKTCQCCAQGKDRARLKGNVDGRRCCAREPRECCERFASAGTVAHLHRLLRAALQDAVEDDILPRNVAKHVHPSRGQRRRIAPFTPEQATRFLSAARRNRLYALFAVALGVGLRKGEALGLTWSDVELRACSECGGSGEVEEVTPCPDCPEAGNEECPLCQGRAELACLARCPACAGLKVSSGYLHIRRTLQRVGGVGVVVGEPKTEESAGKVALPRQLVGILLAHSAAQDQERANAATDWPDTNYVFTSKTGRHLEPRNINRTFESLCRRAEVPVIRFHDLRHSCASLLYAQGVEPGTIQAILRHSTLAVTMEVYVDVFDEVRGAAVDQLGYLFESDDEDG